MTPPLTPLQRHLWNLLEAFTAITIAKELNKVSKIKKDYQQQQQEKKNEKQKSDEKGSGSEHPAA